MKRMLQNLFLTLALVSAFSSAQAYEDAVCEKQAEAFVAEKLQTTVTSIDWIYDARSSSQGVEPTKAYVHTPLCDGSYVLVFSANRSTCTTQAHYGHVPNYLRRVYATGNCSL